MQNGGQRCATAVKFAVAQPRYTEKEEKKRELLEEHLCIHVVSTGLHLLINKQPDCCV